MGIKKYLSFEKKKTQLPAIRNVIKEGENKANLNHGWVLKGKGKGSPFKATKVLRVGRGIALPFLTFRNLASHI